MTAFLTAVATAVAILMVLPFYRLISGPTVYDRMLGAGAVGSKTLVLMALAGFLYGRIEMFVDIVIAYSLLNFIGVLAIAKFLERRGYTP